MPALTATSPNSIHPSGSIWSTILIIRDLLIAPRHDPLLPQASPSFSREVGSPPRRGRQGAQVRAGRNPSWSFVGSGALPGPEGQGKARDLWTRKRKQQSFVEKQKSNVCYHWHVQIPEPVDSRPWNPFLSCSLGLAGKLTSLQLSTRLGT